MASAAASAINYIFGPTEDIEKFYKLGQPLGQPGQFGRAVLAEKLSNPEQKFAVKIINKQRFARSANSAKEVFAAFRQEIEIMKQLDHNNVIKFYEYFENKAELFMVMELCTGGELFDRIAQRGRYTEKDAAAVLREAFEGIAYMHSQRIAHCDLKPDNFLFASNEANAPLRIIDFGMSKFVQRHQYFRKFCGTPYYVAPEVIDGKYNEACDIWSLGVVMFVMLHGYPPFYADPQQYGTMADERVYRLIKAGFMNVVKDGYGPHFPRKIPISESARDLISRLLESDPMKRLTAKRALEHPWLSGQAVDSPVTNLVLKGLLTFNKTNKFKESVLKFMSSDMSEKEVADLKKTFEEIDTNHDGVITIQELKMGLDKLNQDVRSERVAQIFREADLDQDGVLSYEEMMVTYVNRQMSAKEERLWSAFCKFDLDGDGLITSEELKSAIKEDEKVLKDMISQVDVNKDGLVDYQEFLALFHPDDAPAENNAQNGAKDHPMEQVVHPLLPHEKET